MSAGLSTVVGSQGIRRGASHPPATPDPSDLYRQGQEQEEDAANGETVVEVTLLGLGGDLEQDLMTVLS